MSTPQDPRDSGETPEEKSTDRPEPDSGAADRPAAERPRESPGEPFLAPGAPQPPDVTQTPAHAPEPSVSGASSAAPQPPESTGPSEAQQAGPYDPPTEYLPKLLGREPRAADSARPGTGEQSAPPSDPGSAAFAHGRQSGSPEQQPPGGEVPPQAWSARPEEQEPGQAWRQPPGGQQGYGQPPGGSPYPPPGGQYPPQGGQYPPQGGYGSGPEQPGGGYGGPPGAGYGGQPGWGAPEEQGWGAPAQQGWGGPPGAQQGWPGTGAPGGQQGSGGWTGGAPGAGGYPAYPKQQQYQPYGAAAQPERSGPQVLSIIGFVCAAVSLLFCPIVFGAAGIVLGVVGHIRGEPLGKWAAIAAAICLVVGVAIGLLLTGAEIVPNESRG
ncbi:hypothetical protein [Nocardia sp. NBC_01329]|uniref:hypothetical protein n=1 Tax=Nocardia sp. NBC_01329 TaxID=2903594 RepID=UPI002E10EF73|nr:hypothetical protein OG405_00555 [Nocardia sp. NBC_01329]